MKEILWQGTIAMLDKPTREGKVLHSNLYTSWIDLPLTVWDNGQPVGTVQSIALMKDRLVAGGTAADPTLVGRLLRGAVVPVSPNIKFTPEKAIITAVTVMKTGSWTDSHISKAATLFRGLL